MGRCGWQMINGMFDVCVRVEYKAKEDLCENARTYARTVTKRRSRTSCQILRYLRGL